MSKMLAIARKELRSYFESPVAYIVIVVFLLAAGWGFFSTVFLFGRADLRTLFAPIPVSPILLLVTPAFVLILLIPAMTMRLIAEERKSGTFELLTSMPVRNIDVVVGKYLAAFALVAIACLSTVVYAVTISFIGPLDWGPVLSGYLGLLLYCSTVVAIGLMCSTWTRNQIVAFIVAFFVLLPFYLIYYLQFAVPDSIARVIDFLSVSSHLSNMARGVIDTRDVLYYLTMTAAALFVAERTLQRQRA